MMLAVKMPSRAGSLPQDLRDFFFIRLAEKNLNTCGSNSMYETTRETAKIPLTLSPRGQRRRYCRHHTYPRLRRQKPRTCRYF